MTTGLTSATNFIAQKIDKQMVDSVTNAIFQRVAQRAAQPSQATQAAQATQSAPKFGVLRNAYNTESFKSTVQNEVMAEARQSVVKSVNPFTENMLKSQATQAAAATVNSPSVSKGVKESTNDVSTAVRVNSRARISNTMSLQNGMFTSAVRESVMVEAKEQIAGNNDLMSKLQFLNAKTAVGAYPAKQF